MKRSLSGSSNVDASVSAHLARGDNASALRAILDAYGAELHTFVRSVLRNEHAASEAFAQVQEDLWRGLPGFRAESSLRTWAYVVAQRACFRHRARAGNRRDAPLSAASPTALAARTDTSRRRREQRHALLVQLREELPEDDRALMILRVDRDLSWEDVARVLSETATSEEKPHVTVAGLRKRFERIKERLRSRLREFDE
jgi:RNA polymerase sigma-70 factor (ECF subfamily)